MSTGAQRLPARIWREYAAAFADTRHDTLGSSFAEAVPDGDPKVAVFGHIDEIGLVINHVDDEGYLWFGPLGGWDPEVLVGQRVRILGKGGPVAGVVGKKSRHHQDAADREKPSKLRDLWIDVGATDAKDAARLIGVGDLAVLEQPLVQLANGRIATRAAVTCWADNSRHACAWAAERYAKARGRGCDHPHAVRILARAWLRVLWRAWTDRKPYDRALHGAAVRLAA